MPSYTAGKVKLALLGLLFIVFTLGVVFLIENSSIINKNLQADESGTIAILSDGANPSSTQGDLEKDTNSHRKLSTDFNYFTGQSQNTYNGKVPRTTCAAGFYRPQGSTDMLMVSGQREDGCVPCPAGRYGATPGLSSPLCTAGCPPGTYSDRTGLTSPSQCAFCPVGKYGQTGGLSTMDCSANCPVGKYTSTVGNVFKTDCKFCPPGFRSWQCVWAIAPMRGQVQDHLKSGLGSGVVTPTFGYKPKFLDPIPN
jgi:hypothetical protein